MKPQIALLTLYQVVAANNSLLEDVHLSACLRYAKMSIWIPKCVQNDDFYTDKSTLIYGAKYRPQD